MKLLSKNLFNLNEISRKGKQIDDIRNDVAKIDFQALSESYTNEREIIEESTKAQDTKIESMVKQVNGLRDLVQNVAIPMNSSRIRKSSGCIKNTEDANKPANPRPTNRTPFNHLSMDIVKTISKL